MSTNDAERLFPEVQSLGFRLNVRPEFHQIESARNVAKQDIIVRAVALRMRDQAIHDEDTVNGRHSTAGCHGGQRPKLAVHFGRGRLAIGGAM